MSPLIKKISDVLTLCVSRAKRFFAFITGGKKRIAPPLLPTLLVVVLLFVLQTHFTHAAGILGTIGSWIGDITYWIISKTAYGITWIAATITGFLVVVQAWIIAFLLDINGHVVSSMVVQTGFSITLAVANLGFVLGIIIMAIATILRYEPYGMKATLRNLVIAALLVNFSLVLAGVPIAISDALSRYFLGGVTATTTGCAGLTPIACSDSTFAASLAAAFNPQRGFLTGTATDPSAPSNQDTVGGAIAAIFAPLISIFFTLAMMVSITFTLGAIIIMLLIRYVTLAILLVLMPFAWLLWIFPATANNWRKWWDHFMRWTFFPPIMLFFLWLAILVSDHLPDAVNPGLGAGSTPLSAYTAGSDSLFAAINAGVHGSASGTIGAALQSVVVVGLMIGGLYAANSLAITFASNFLSGVKAGVRGAANYTVRLPSKILGGTAGAIRGTGTAINAWGSTHTKYVFPKGGPAKPEPTEVKTEPKTVKEPEQLNLPFPGKEPKQYEFPFSNGPAAQSRPSAEAAAPITATAPVSSPVASPSGAPSSGGAAGAETARASPKEKPKTFADRFKNIMEKEENPTFFKYVQTGARMGAREGSDIAQLRGAGRILNLPLLRILKNREGLFQQTFGEAYRATTKTQQKKFTKEDRSRYSRDQWEDFKKRGMVAEEEKEAAESVKEAAKKLDEAAKSDKEAHETPPTPPPAPPKTA